MDDLERFKKKMEEIYKLFEKKNSEYSGSYKYFGLKGRTSRLGERTYRLKKLVWEKDSLEDEKSIKNNLEDMAVEAIISLMCLEDKNFDGNSI